MSYCAYRSDEEVRNLLTTTPGIFGDERVRNYNISHRAASYFLISLLGEVNHVELANWPQSKSVPVKEEPTFEDSVPRLLGSLGTPEGQKTFEELWKKAQADKAAAEAAQQQVERTEG